MADVFLSYARPNRELVLRLRQILSSRFTVWWDEDLTGGDYRIELEKQLGIAKCVIPVWCKVSRSDADVLDEVAFASARGIPLLPVRLEAVDPPIGYGTLQTIDLVGWAGDANDPRIARLFESVEKVAKGRPQLLNRMESLALSRGTLPLPAFFRSVSSYETQLLPDAAVKALRLVNCQLILVSAYDTLKGDVADRVNADLKACRGNGAIVMLDSGNYEAFRKADTSWTRKRFSLAASRTEHDLVFSFDGSRPRKENASAEELAAAVITGVKKDQAFCERPVLPIVHAPKRAAGGYQSSVLPKLIKLVARELRPPIIAVPERELGDGILARARATFEIRRSLDELGFYQPVHLLGTGNPTTIAVLAASGADSFDGLEWCRTVANHEMGTLHHFQHLEFYAWQSEQLSSSPVTREAMANDRIEYAGKVAFHNLDFFESWMAEVVEMVRTRKFDRFLSSRIPRGTRMLNRLEAAVPEVFG